MVCERWRFGPAIPAAIPWQRCGARLCLPSGNGVAVAARPFITASVRAGRDPEDARAWLAKFPEHMRDAGVGSVSEIFDGDAPHEPRGCIAQAWSVAKSCEPWWKIYTSRASVFAEYRIPLVLNWWGRASALPPGVRQACSLCSRSAGFVPSRWFPGSRRRRAEAPAPRGWPEKVWGTRVFACGHSSCGSISGDVPSGCRPHLIGSAISSWGSFRSAPC